MKLRSIGNNRNAVGIIEKMHGGSVWESWWRAEKYERL